MTVVINTHKFHVGETFDSHISDENYKVTDVGANTIRYEYRADGSVVSEDRIPKEKARYFVQCGRWKKPLI